MMNYGFGTWLSGWDNLHPEFNFAVNIKRSVFAVWQEYQGLGLLGGMGHAADLFRQIFLWIVSLVLPISINRYFFHFLMLLIGPLGVYFLIKNISVGSSTSEESRSLPRHHPRCLDGLLPSEVQVAPLLGAVFYLFNLATLQMFYVPFEPYSVHYAFLPWLFWSYLNFLKEASKRNLFFLFLINLLAVAQGYVITFFFVYIVSLTILSFYFLFKRQKLQKMIIAYAVIFLMNSYWLLPNLYFVFQKVDVNVSAKINQMSTEDNLLRNKKFGGLSDTAILRGFLFDNVEMDREGVNRYMMEGWKKYLDNPLVATAGYSLFGIVIIGIFYCVKKREKEALIFLPVLLFSFTVLSNDTPVFSILADFFYKLPLFGQVFRFTYTKFSILTSFCFSVFFAQGCIALISMIKGNFAKKSITFALLVLPLIFLAPVFSGKLFYQKEKAIIPKEYFQVFDFFKNQPKSGRIASFPQYTFWGWSLYRWPARRNLDEGGSYSGSGFLWYGIEQPILDRAFDVWSREDENYYHEISYALYSRNKDLLEKLLEKYQIKWLLIDGNIISFASGKTLYLDHFEQLILASQKVNLVSQIGKIKIYRVNLEYEPKDFVFLADSLPVVGPEYKWNNLDKAFEEYGNYISDNPSTALRTGRQQITNNNYIYYPFSSLFTGRQQEELEFDFEDKGEYFSFKTKIPKELAGSKLIIPALNKEEVTEIDENDLSKRVEKYPQIFLDGELLQIPPPSGKSSSATPEVSLLLSYIREGNLEIRVPKINGYYSYSLQPFDSAQGEPKNCDQFNRGIYTHDKIIESDKNLLRLTSVNSSNCLDFDLPNLTQRLGYIISIENRNIEGKSLLFSVINKNSQRADLETYLPKNSPGRSNSVTPSRWPDGLLEGGVNKSYFVFPPMEQYGLGYTLYFDNISIGRVKTVNDLGRITVNPIPYRFLTGLKVLKDSSVSSTIEGVRASQAQLATLEVSYRVQNPNPSLYQITMNNETMKQLNNVTMVLSQSYDSGWRAYQFNNSQLSIINYLFPFWFGEEIKDHVLVNNWENGWQLSNETMKQCNNGQCKIIIVYLPQYLEYVGFILLGLGLLIFLFYPNNIRFTHNS
jgi:hypothetical protein